MLRRATTILTGFFMISMPFQSSFSAAPEESKTTTTLAFMGDTMLGRLVSEVIPDHRPTYFWGNTLPLLKACDLRLLNLETSITTTNERWSEWRKAFYYKAVPQAVDVLRAANIDYANLANNHVLDFSEPGLRDTIAYLDKAGIAHTGAGETPDKAWAPVRLRANGVRVGVFSCADHYPEWDVARGEPGIAFVKIPPDEPTWRRIEETIQALRSTCDIVVCSIHWGPNMVEFPSQQRIDMAHRLVEAGVNVVHGHSAHVFQGVEIYGDAIILYDTGEFIDDYAIDRRLRNDLSFLYRLTWQDGGWREVELIPVRIDELQVNVATGPDAERTLKMFAGRTAPFDTRYTVTSGRVLIQVR